MKTSSDRPGGRIRTIIAFHHNPSSSCHIENPILLYSIHAPPATPIVAVARVGCNPAHVRRCRLRPSRTSSRWFDTTRFHARFHPARVQHTDLTLTYSRLWDPATDGKTLKGARDLGPWDPISPMRCPLFATPRLARRPFPAASSGISMADDVYSHAASVGIVGPDK